MSRRDITRKSSHFLAFPLHTNENLRRVVNDFQTELLSDKVAVKGLDKTIVVNPWRLHITVGVVGLEEDVGASEGPRYTVESALKLLESLHPSIDKILGGGQLEVDLDKLDVTQVASGGPRDEKFAHVLFVGPHKRNETLQNVMDLVYDTFKNQGYITESRSSKIHCTILNTRYRQPRERRPFSYSGVLKSQACKHFKMMRLSPSQGEQATTARRVQLGAFELGEIQLWKMGSHWENDKYFSHGGISWAKNKPNKIQKGGKCQGLTQSEIVVETKNGPLLGAGTNQNRVDEQATNKEFSTSKLRGLNIDSGMRLGVEHCDHEKRPGECLNCSDDSRQGNSLPRSIQYAEDSGDLVLSMVSKNDPQYSFVQSEFKRNWQSGTCRPELKCIYKVVLPWLKYSAFNSYLENVEYKGRFLGRLGKAGQKMLLGNEKMLFYGTPCACNIGEADWTLCQSQKVECSLCKIIMKGFKDYPKHEHKYKLRKTPISACQNSHKAAMYALTANTNFSAVLACRVIVGRPYDVPDSRSYFLPSSFDSIYIKPGEDPREGEFAVFNEDAICVDYLIVFS